MHKCHPHYFFSLYTTSYRLYHITNKRVNTWIFLVFNSVAFPLKAQKEEPTPEVDYILDFRELRRLFFSFFLSFLYAPSCSLWINHTCTFPKVYLWAVPVLFLFLFCFFAPRRACVRFTVLSSLLKSKVLSVVILMALNAWHQCLNRVTLALTHCLG